MRVRHNLKDRVIAISSNKIKNTQPRIKGDVYIVEDIMYCIKCGSQFINIGYESKKGNLLPKKVILPHFEVIYLLGVQKGKKQSLNPTTVLSAVQMWPFGEVQWGAQGGL